MARKRRQLRFTCKGKEWDSTCGNQHATCVDALKCTHRAWRKDHNTDLRPAHTDGTPLTADEEQLVRTWEETPPDVTPWSAPHGGAYEL